MATDTPHKITAITSRYIEDNLQFWVEYANGLRRLSEGAVGKTSTGRPDARLSDLTERARDLVHLSVNHYSKLLTTYADFASRFVTTIVQPAEHTPPDDRAPVDAGGGSRPMANVELTFSGPAGETVTQSFVIANRKSAAVEVSFELTEFVSEDGKIRFRAPVEFLPEHLALPPGTEAVVRCRIAMDPPFLPGTRYMALVRIMGFPEIRTALIIVPQDASGKRDPEPSKGPRASGTSPRAAPRKRGDTKR